MKKTTIGISGLLGLASTVWAGFNGYHLANGTEANTFNVLATALPALFGAGGIGVAGIIAAADHIALLVLTVSRLADEQSMSLIHQLAARDPKAPLKP